MKKRIIILAIILAALLALWFLYSYSFVEISVENSSDNQTTLSLKDQRTGKTTIFQHTGNTTKRLVRRSSYEILGNQAGNSGLKIFDTGGFLSTKSVDISLKPEKHRTFIGDNPRFCMDYIQGVLLSYNCGDAFDNIQVHMPATAKQPTFTKKEPNTIEASIADAIDTPEGYFALVREPNQGDITGSQFKLFRFNSDLLLSNGIALNGLEPDLTYKLMRYDAGFIAYDTPDYRDINYFPSSTSPPRKIEKSQPKDSILKPYSISTRGTTLAIAYSDNTEGDVADIHKEGAKRVRNEIHILKDNKTFKIDLQGQLSKIELCAENKLCILRDKDLEVYDITNQKATYLYRLTAVEAIERTGNALLAARFDGIYELDVDGQSAYGHYTFGEYTYCGIKTDSNGYTVCMSNKRKDKVALRINPALTNSDNIDKKINELLGVPSIKDLTINGKYIHITPNLGKLTFQEDIDSFGYDTEKKAEVREQIQGKLNTLQLEKNGYSVIFTLKL